MILPDHVLQRKARVRTRWLLAAALLLYVLSRLPFLVAHPDWGPFSYEHCFFLSGAKLVDALRAQFPGHDFTMSSVVPYHFRDDFHGGAFYVGTLTQKVASGLGSFGLLPLKLLSTAHALLALALYLLVLRRLWPDELARTALPVLVAWLAPPTMLLWSTLLMMGHYYETWLVHALLLPPLLLVLRGRMPLWGMAATGLGCGLLSVYAFSSLVFPLLFVLLHARLGPRGGGRRLLGGAALLAAAAAPLALYFQSANRWHAFLNRVSVSGVGQRTAAGPWQRLLSWFDPQLYRDAALNGDGWTRRGLSVLLAGHPREDPLSAATALICTALLGAGVVYLLLHAARLLWPRGAPPDLRGRFLGAHGVLLSGQVGAAVLFEQPYPASAAVCYKAMTYACVMLGAGQLLAAAWGHRGRWRPAWRAGVAALCALFCAGWVSSARDNLRPLGRPPLQRCDTDHAANLGASFGLPDERGPRAGWAAARCRRAFPRNRAYCRALGWDKLFTQDGPADCARQAPEQALACAAALGQRLYLERICSPYSDQLDYRAAGPELCAGLQGALRWACRSGAHQGYSQCQNALASRCAGLAPAASPRRRACLEQLAWLAQGAGPFPRPAPGGPDACEPWPEAWRGLCQRAWAAPAAPPAGPSCEEVYLARFARALPEQDSLLYDQCLLLEGEEATAGLYPFCAVGVARITAGLDCRWRGGPWPGAAGGAAASR